MTQATHALQQVAAARAALTAAAERLEEETQRNTKLLVQLSDAKTRSAEAFRLGRQGDPDGKHAMAMKVADADAIDIQGLLDALSRLLTALNAEFIRCQAAEHEAEENARREENEITATALTSHIGNLKKLHSEAVDERHQFYRKMGLNTAAAELLKHIKALELEFLEAVAECYRIHVEIDKDKPHSATARRMTSAFTFYTPHSALKDLVSQGAKPLI